MKEVQCHMGQIHEPHEYEVYPHLGIPLVRGKHPTVKVQCPGRTVRWEDEQASEA